jgi:ApaG protein
MRLGYAQATTAKIKVSVESFFQQKASDASKDEYAFAYRVTIENNSNHPVQLISRFWHIIDTLADNKEVKGEGVVGEQPVIIPGEKYQYMSWCMLTSEIGKMEGWYNFKDLVSQSDFRVMIPSFCLQTPNRLN